MESRDESKMPTSEKAKLAAALRRTWPGGPSVKAERYIGTFFGGVRVGSKIKAQVVGNHGTYTVSIEVKDKEVVSACSCYIGKGGFCHHCEALAKTFLQDPTGFREIKTKKCENVQSLDDVHAYLQGVTLDALLVQLREKGVTQKAFAESIGMNTRHLSVIKSSEARNHFFNELGATKLACLWMLEHLSEFKGR
jgi:uncharacterized Zn finger protein